MSSPLLRKTSTPYKKTAFLMVAAAILLLVASVAGLLTKTVTLSSQGTVKAIGVGVYWDSICSSKVSSIDWGTIEAGSVKMKMIYIRNEGTVAMTLSMNTTSWDPPTASKDIGLTWNYTGQPIDPGGVIPVTLTLSVSSSITGISTFKFDIIITGSG